MFIFPMQCNKYLCCSFCYKPSGGDLKHTGGACELYANTTSFDMGTWVSCVLVSLGALSRIAASWEMAARALPNHKVLYTPFGWIDVCQREREKQFSSVTWLFTQNTSVSRCLCVCACVSEWETRKSCFRPAHQVSCDSVLSHTVPKWCWCPIPRSPETTLASLITRPGHCPSIRLATNPRTPFLGSLPWLRWLTELGGTLVFVILLPRPQRSSQMKTCTGWDLEGACSTLLWLWQWNARGASLPHPGLGCRHHLGSLWVTRGVPIAQGIPEALGALELELGSKTKCMPYYSAMADKMSVLQVKCSKRSSSLSHVAPCLLEVASFSPRRKSLVPTGDSALSWRVAFPGAVLWTL